jgi:hypothetical protein
MLFSKAIVDVIVDVFLGGSVLPFVPEIYFNFLAT